MTIVWEGSSMRRCQIRILPSCLPACLPAERLRNELSFAAAREGGMFMHWEIPTKTHHPLMSRLASQSEYGHWPLMNAKYSADVPRKWCSE
mmetsp:Transcript_20915/g.31204  ORF Transcript_20915/g.31204 Transcript_20915/m.31204 type:complete len:91 (-) Transcript_20915:14-286(-)